MSISLGIRLTERNIRRELSVGEVDFNIQRLGLWLKYTQKSEISRAEWDLLKCDSLPPLDDKYYIGIVCKVDDTTVYTIEGNTSAGEQVIPNGGAVCKKSYKLYNSRIAGYGRPDYSGTDSSGSDPEPVKKVWVKAELPMLRKGMHGDAVMVWQIIAGVDPDGDFGTRTLDATVDFQTAHGLDGDGIVGQKTWTAGLAGIS